MRAIRPRGSAGITLGVAEQSASPPTPMDGITQGVAEQSASPPTPVAGITRSVEEQSSSLPTPMDCAVPASVLAPDPGGSRNLNEEQSSLLNPESYSWWKEINTQISSVDYLSTVDMGTTKAVLRNPDTYKRPVQTGLLYLIRALSS